MNTVPRMTYGLAAGGLALAATLSGCASAGESAAGEANAGESDATLGGPYTDGEYAATGEYQSPGGTETIEVDVTIEGDIVTAVMVTPNGTTPNAIRYQGEFSAGIAAEVVGVNIDELAVDKVAGSSLTSGGFADAIEQIKAEAVA